MPVNDSSPISSMTSLRLPKMIFSWLSYSMESLFAFSKSLSHFCLFNDGDSFPSAADADSAPASLNASFSCASPGFKCCKTLRTVRWKQPGALHDRVRCVVKFPNQDLALQKAPGSQQFEDLLPFRSEIAVLLLEREPAQWDSRPKLFQIGPELRIASFH